MRRFEDPSGGDVNYVAFIQAIDEEYWTGHGDGERKVRMHYLSYYYVHIVSLPFVWFVVQLKGRLLLN